MKSWRIAALSDSRIERERIARWTAPIAWSLIAYATAVSCVAQAQMPQTNFDALTTTLDGYEHAVQSRASEKSSGAENRLLESTKQLRAAGQAYAESVRDVTGEAADGRRILRDLREYEETGARLVTFADDQRALAVEYSDRCATMGTRARNSIDEAATMFGHVFARRSLIALNLQIEDLQGRAGNLSLAHANDLDAVSEALATTEATVAATLKSDEHGLTRTQGKNWTAAMQEDLEWLSASRTRLTEMDVHQAVLLSRVKELRRRLAKQPIFTESAAPETPTVAVDLRSTANAGESSSVETPHVDAGRATSAAAPQPNHSGSDNKQEFWKFVGAALLTSLLIVMLARRGGDAARRTDAPAATHDVETEAPDPQARALDRIAERFEDRWQNKIELIGADVREDLHGRLAATSADESALALANLSRAFEQHELELVFQPELNPRTFAVESADALVCWSPPDGRITILEQLPMEGPELMRHIGSWTLCAAVRAAARWHQGNWPRPRINVSVPTQQLREQRFVERVEALLDEHRLSPACIELGVTEAALRDGPQTLEALRQLRAHGIGVALNDFGTGALPLDALQHYPLTRIRLDRTLAIDLDVRDPMLAIARSVTGWAKRIGMCIDYDGVEPLARRLRETHLCELRHYVRCEPPPDPAGSTGTILYESCIGFSESFIVKSTARRKHW